MSLNEIRACNIGGVIATEEDRYTLRKKKNYPSATLCTTNPTWSGALSFTRLDSNMKPIPIMASSKLLSSENIGSLSTHIYEWFTWKMTETFSVITADLYKEFREFSS
jgi:hypothetical protein